MLICSAPTAFWWSTKPACVHSYVPVHVSVCVFIYLCMYVYVCTYATLLGFLCVWLWTHSTDTVTSPSVLVLIVQMVKLAAPAKQQTIYSNRYTHIDTHTHTNHLLGLLIRTQHVHACWSDSAGQPVQEAVCVWVCVCVCVSESRNGLEFSGVFIYLRKVEIPFSSTFVLQPVPEQQIKNELTLKQNTFMICFFSFYFKTINSSVFKH